MADEIASATAILRGYDEHRFGYISAARRSIARGVAQDEVLRGDKHGWL
ncbi:MAG: hypothetical protein WA183_12155 [Chthoniobacterales bacterium]